MTDFEKYLKPSERQTAEKTADVLLAAGFSLTVFDGEEETVKQSTDKVAILGAMGTTEEDYLRVYFGSVYWGMVRFVWGNEDWVAICDYSTRLEEALRPVTEWMDEQSNAAEYNLLAKDWKEGQQ